MPTGEQRRDSGELLREVEELRRRLADLEARSAVQHRADEERLRGVEDRHRTLIETTGTGFVVLNGEGAVLDANAEYVRMAGRQSLEDILGRCVTEWTAEKDRARNAREVAKCLEQGFVRDLVICYVDSQGRDVPVEVNATVVESEKGPAILTLCRDISNRRLTEESIRRRKEDLRATLESTADGILAVDETGKIIFVNDRFVKMWGIPQELVDRGVDDELLAHVLSQLRDPEQFLSKVRELYQSDRDSFDTLCFTDARVFERYSRPLLREGRLSGRVWSFRDATERIASETALQASEARYKMVTDLMSDYVFKLEVGEDGSIVMDMVTENFHSITGLSLDDVKTADLWAKVIHPDDLPGLIRLLDRLANQGGTAQVECRSNVRSGQSRWVNIVGRAVADPQTGRIAAIVGAVKDISDRKQAEEERLRLEAQMLQAQKLESLGILAGGIAHDFNNILVAILGNADLALQDIPAHSPARPLLEDIDSAAHRAADLCRQMLAYSGRGRFDVRPLDLSALVRDMVQILDVTVSRKAVLHCDLPHGLPFIEADASQVRQIVMNLIINASEAITGGGGEVAVSTGLVQHGPETCKGTHFHGEPQPGPCVFLEVVDNGSGMDGATTDRIFDPFFSTKFTGRGLGLAAVLGIVRGHKGALRVQSEPGQGTTFTVYFPLAPDRTEPVPENAPACSGWAGKGAVLLVDDEAQVRHAVSRMLERLGFQVFAVGDGQEALEVFRRNRDAIRCVLLDLTMPRMDGERTFHELRALDANVRVIVSSGYSEQEVASRFGGQGMSGFICKPYKMDRLAAALKAVLGGV